MKAAVSAVPCGWGREAGEKPEEAAAPRSPPPGWFLIPRARRGSGEPSLLPRSPLSLDTGEGQRALCISISGVFSFKTEADISEHLCLLSHLSGDELTPVFGCPSVILQSTLRNTAMEITGCAWSPAPRSCPLRATSSYGITPTSG